MKLKHGPYSPSRLEVAVCGHRFYNEYVESTVAKVETLPQGRGAAMHEVFEYITKTYLGDRHHIFTPREIQEEVVRAVHRHPVAYEEIDILVDMAKRYVERPPHMIADDSGIELKFAIKPKLRPDGSFDTYQDDKVYPDRVEERMHFEECDYNDPEAWFRGRADILSFSDNVEDPSALIIDHKTQPNIEAASTFQMGFYAWVVSRVYEYLNEIQTVLHFSRYGYYSDAYTWSRQELFQIEDAIMTRIGAIESATSWPAVPNKDCQYCPLLTRCPVMSQYVEETEKGLAVTNRKNFKILGSQDRAVKAASALQVLEEVVKVIKKELKDYTKANEGRVAIAGKVFGFQAGDQKINWDAVNRSPIREKVYAVFEKHGVDPKLFMGFSQTFTDGVWYVDKPELVKELSDLMPRKVETRFGGFKT